MSRRPTGGTLVLLCAAAMALAPASLGSLEARAQADTAPCPGEVEPNDTAEDAASLSGDLCVVGQLAFEDQDLLLWHLPEDTAAHPQSITLSGVSGTLTSLKVLPITSSPGSVPLEVGSQILVVEAPPEAHVPVTLPDVLLPAGRYLLGISRSERADGARPWSLDYQVTITASSASDADVDVPGAGLPPLEGDFWLAGRSSINDVSAVAWTVPILARDQGWTVEALGVLGSGMGIRIESPDGRILADSVADALGRVVIPDLGLPEGTYRLTVTVPSERPLPFHLRARAGPRGGDVEPNGAVDLATPIGAGTAPARGLLYPAGDVDTYLLEIPDGAQLLHDVRLISPVPRRRSLCLAALDDTRIQCHDGESNVTLAGLLLAPGTYVLSVSGEADDIAAAEAQAGYVLRVDTTMAPIAGFEAEPNDLPAYASSVDPVAGVRGRGAPGDVDVFRVQTTGEPQLWEAHAVGEGLGSLSWLRADGTTLGSAGAEEGGAQASLRDLYLVPGEHLISVMAVGDYELRLEPLGPPDPDSEREPNNDATFAEPWRLSRERLIGRLVSPGDADVFRFSLAGQESISLIVKPPRDLAVDLRVEASRLTVGTIRSAGPGEETVYEGLLGPGDYDVILTVAAGRSGSEERYELKRVRGDPYPSTIPAAHLPVELSLHLETDEVAAYWPTGQRVSGELRVTNSGPTDLVATLDAVTSHFAWRASTAQEVVSLAPGETRSVEMAIVAQPDAWADEPVRIGIRARDEDGAQATTHAYVIPRRDAEPVAPIQAWPVPEALLGGLDVASLALGATTLPAIDPAGEDQLHDGIALLGTGFVTSSSGLPLTLTVDLAGDAPIPIAGTILDPIAGDAIPGDVPAEFELLLSTDGYTFGPVLRGELSTLLAEQAFVLEEPVEATWAQLRIDSVHGGGLQRVALGEWKVVADPEAAAAFGALDLASPARGGHVAWMEPQPTEPGQGGRLLDDDLLPEVLYPPGRTSFSFVIGFKAGRAAQLASLGFDDPLPSTDGQRFERLEVATSFDGPAGPWQAAGTWELERAADGAVSGFTWPKPVWARYVRLDGEGPRKDDQPWELPGAIHVFERVADEEYTSILGEWGGTSRSGPYERQMPTEVGTIPDDVADDDEPATARALIEATASSGRVSHGLDEDWFSFVVPEGENSLSVDVTGRPVVGVALELHDAEGFRVPVLFGPGQRQGSVRYRAQVEGGAEYRLRVFQPPSSIVFTYDTSGSVGPFLEDVHHGLRAFSSDVQPGRESVLITPFEEEPLLDGWSDQPFELQNAVDRYVGGGGSSSAETALIEAATQLSAREGARAILVITDAETSSFQRSTELWRILAAVRPLVFSVHVGGSGEPYLSTAWMQDWAGVGGGVYRYAASHGEMDRAFDRLATWLRRSAGYELTMETTFREEPPPSRQPGTVSVRSAPGAAATISPDVGVGVILDTSGSMLKKLQGRRRIDVARDALLELLGERLPAGTPVALRVFGAPQDDCGSRLLVPLGPLDPVALSTLVEELEIEKGTATPIAAALERVPDDLAAVRGSRVVVLITDGGETCDGDVSTAIRDLARRGIDARVNIVGFALSDKKLKADMRRWATSGKGAYFDARGADQLARSIERATRAPFRVLDMAGNEVASGTLDGGAVPVPPGDYSIVVLTDPPTRFDAVSVGPGEDETVELAARTEPGDGGPPVVYSAP